jgi:hypothetical protein
MAVIETQFAWPEARLALKASQCCADACREPVAGDVEGHPFCLEHFISASLHEMETQRISLKEKPATVGTLRKFLAVCGEQAKTLAESEALVNQSARNRLREVIRCASQLQKNLRRSSRLKASVPVWLRREDPRNTWEEETWTSTVSLHGAGFICRHSVEINGLVVLCRRDKGSRAQARVVYSLLDADGCRHVGVELVDQADFWGLPQVARPA